MSFFRIHPANDPIANILNADRPDGWAMDGEEAIRGIPVCSSIPALIEYAALYGMMIESDDLLVECHGRYAGTDHDAHADRCIVESYDVLDVTGAELAEAIAWVRKNRIEIVRVAHIIAEGDLEALYDENLADCDEDEETGEEIYESLIPASVAKLCSIGAAK